MGSEMQFVALGGGQEVGASCYFLQTAGARILLDCGKTPLGAWAPDFSRLLRPPFLESLNQLDAIFISHIPVTPMCAVLLNGTVPPL